MDLVVATTNSNKLSEIKEIFQDLPLTIFSLADVSMQDVDVEETGTTFAENAYIKAAFYSNVTHKLCVADDSGLEVTALNNEPGVASNRWHPGTDGEKNQALLNRIATAGDRSARFVTVACLLQEGAEPLYFEGVITGKIAEQPSGSAGFGYDPIFTPDGETDTFAQLGSEYKAKYSHRARAFMKVKDHLVTTTSLNKSPKN